MLALVFTFAALAKGTRGEGRHLKADSETCWNEVEMQLTTPGSCVYAAYTSSAISAASSGCSQKAAMFNAMYDCSSFGCKLVLCDDFDEWKKEENAESCTNMECRWTRALFIGLVTGLGFVALTFVAFFISCLCSRDRVETVTVIQTAQPVQDNTRSTIVAQEIKS